MRPRMSGSAEKDLSLAANDAGATKAAQVGWRTVSSGEGSSCDGVGLSGLAAKGVATAVPPWARMTRGGESLARGALCDAG